MSKKLFLLLVISCSLGCTKNERQHIPINGKIHLANGKSELDSIDYTCELCDSMLLDTSIFHKLITTGSLATKEGLKYPLSYIPKKITINLLKMDSLYHYRTNQKIDSILSAEIRIDYIAKNSYGNELEGKNTEYYFFKGSNIENLDTLIKLSPLSIAKEGFVTPSLNANSIGNKGWINILPSSNNDLILRTSMSCLSKDAMLHFHLSNGEMISIKNWNDFNCEGTAYFNKFNTQQIELLREFPCTTLTLSDDEILMCNLPPNRQHYFTELMNLWFPKK